MAYNPAKKPILRIGIRRLVALIHGYKPTRSLTEEESIFLGNIKDGLVAQIKCSRSARGDYDEHDA